MNTLLAFRNITLIDGTGREPIPDAAVAVRGSKIIYAGPARTWLPTYKEDIINLDFAGKVLLPGLIDCHVHLSGSGELDSRFDEPNDASMALKMLANARRHLAAGVTTVRDLGGWNEVEFDVRKAIKRGDFTGPRLLLAGRFISISESGSDQYPGMYRVADGVDEVRKAVREQVKHGADVVKLGVTGAVLVEDGVPGATHFNSDEIRVAVDEAGKSGRRVAAHAHGIDGIRNAVQAGVHTIEHGTFLHQGPDVIEEMVRRGTFLVPTLKSGRDVSDGDSRHVPAWIVEKMKETQKAAEKSVKLAYQAGVQIAMGSDAATPLNYHGDNALEIAWMHEAGLKPMDALMAATLNAARALGWESKVGSIEEGKLADLLVLDADPLEDLKRLADKKVVRAVFLDGRLVARQALDSYPRSILAQDCLSIN